MPFTPPSGELNQPPPLLRPDRNWTSFRRRLFLLPVWFVLGVFPVGLTVALVGNIFYALIRNSSAVWVGGGAVVLLISWGLFKYLVAPLALEKRLEHQWALVGVPLIVVAWAAFLAAVLFALCGGSNFH